MGEKSKLIGEYGEKSVENFLNLIGWSSLLKGITVDCVQQEEHGKKTHGIDFAFLYKSPLIDLVLKKVHISVKFTDKPYPNSPSSKFKEYFDDLASAIDCFQLSPKHHDWISNIQGFNSSENIGVLFWLSNDDSSYTNLIDKVNSIITPSNYNYDHFYLVDNERIEFIYQVILCARSYHEDYNYSFFYPETGKNINPLVKSDHGNILTVEYINSSILPLRLEAKNGSQTKLMLFSIHPFEKEDLKRLISLSQTLSKSWAAEILIAFNDYNQTRHVEDVNLAKSAFESTEFTKKISVINYTDNFRNLQF